MYVKITYKTTNCTRNQKERPCIRKDVHWRVASVTYQVHVVSPRAVEGKLKINNFVVETGKGVGLLGYSRLACVYLVLLEIPGVPI